MKRRIGFTAVLKMEWVTGLTRHAVEAGEVELASDNKLRCSHGFEARVATRLVFGSLKQAVGLAGLSPGDGVLEVSTNLYVHVQAEYNVR